MPDRSPNAGFRFGVFEVDPMSGEVRKYGIRIRLQDQPFKILVALLEKRGEVVTREELRERLWGSDTFVDFDHGLSAAVNRLREALGDSADNPRFVETMARRGYRFIAPVEGGPQPLPPPAAAPGSSLKKQIWIMAGLLAAGAALWIRQTGRDRSAPQPELVPLTTLEGVERDPTFSPDASQVAFSWDGPRQDNFDIYVKVIGEDSPVRLTSNPAPDRFPAWSPDGRYVAFLREGQGIYLIPPVGGTERKVSDWPGIAAQLAWSEDGRFLAFGRASQSAEVSGIFAIPAAGGPAARLTTAEAAGYDHTPAYSPDGQWLAFARNRSGAWDGGIVVAGKLQNAVISPDSIRRLTEHLDLTDSIAWTRDSRSVVVSGRYPNAGARSRLWRYGVDGRTEAGPLGFAPEGSRAIAVSRSGRRAAFSQMRSDYDLWNLETGALGKSPISSTRLDYSPQFSPDGKRVAFASSRSGSQQVWVASTDGSAAVQLTRTARPSGSPRWSPDGQWIVFDTRESDADWGIRLIEAGGGQPRPVASHPASDKIPSFSHDGKWIYFSSNRGGRDEIYRVPVAGGEAVQLTDQGGAVGRESADGKSIYYVKELAQCGPLFTRPLTGGPERQVLESVCARDFEITAAGIYYIGGKMDDLRLAFRGGGGQEIVVKLLEETGRSREIARSGRPLYLVIGMSVSPDRKSILFAAAADAGADLMLVENFR